MKLRRLLERLEKAAIEILVTSAEIKEISQDKQDRAVVLRLVWSKKKEETIRQE